MIKPYTAVGLIPTVRGIRTRSDIKRNLEHLSHLVKAAAWLSSLDLPVRLIAFPEGALQGFNDEVLDLDHVQFARECAIDLPGEETEALGKIARTYNAFIMAQAKAHHPEIKDRFFNQAALGSLGFMKPGGKPIHTEEVILISSMEICSLGRFSFKMSEPWEAVFGFVRL